MCYMEIQYDPVEDIEESPLLEAVAFGEQLLY